MFNGLGLRAKKSSHSPGLQLCRWYTDIRVFAKTHVPSDGQSANPTVLTAEILVVSNIKHIPATVRTDWNVQ